jgi:hypothetical protein
MAHATALFMGLVIALVGDAPDSSQNARTYQALEAKAGRDSQAQVKLALWCEAHAMEAEKVKHLARAVLFHPANVTARGLLGLVAFGDRWESPAKIGDRLKADEQRAAKLEEYHARRARLAEKEDAIRKAEARYEDGGRPELASAVRLKGNHELAGGHASIGFWCDQNGLGPEETAHYTMAVHLDPSRDSSWRHLGFVKRDGRWVSAEQARSDDREEHAQRLANRHSEPLLKKWKKRLLDASSSPASRAEAEEQLADVTDPRAVPSIVKVFSGAGSEAEQMLMIQLLDQIDDARSSKALADLAVSTRSEYVRRAATAVLKQRPRRDYAGPLVEMIRGKIRYTIEPVEGPSSTGTLILDTPRIRMILTYDAPPVFQPAATFRGYAGYDANGLPIIVQGKELERGVLLSPNRLFEIELRTAGMIAAANIKAQVVQQRMVADLKEVELLNEQAEENNARIAPVLQVAADAPADLKDDEERWHVWWYDTLGYSYQSPPQVTVAQNASPSQLPPPYITTCFAAGTPIYTLEGHRNIEAIEVGDQVLSQDAATGGLSFQPVVFVHHNPPGKTLRVSLTSGESLVCSVYHRFWRANLGWAMARELKTGDTLRTVGGLIQVTHVEPDEIQPLYNLDVAGPRTFFAGKGSLLVHDNTLPDHRLKPFDALPVVEVTAGPE